MFEQWLLGRWSPEALITSGEGHRQATASTIGSLPLAFSRGVQSTKQSRRMAGGHRLATYYENDGPWWWPMMKTKSMSIDDRDRPKIATCKLVAPNRRV